MTASCPIPTGDRLAASERALLASVIEAAGVNLPPTVARLLECSPESFCDARLGAIAVGVGALRREGRAVSHELILPLLANDQTGAALILGTLGNGLPFDLAEKEGELVWRAYQTRRTRQLLGEALDEIDRQPDMAGVIATITAKGFAELGSNGQADDWSSLVEDGAAILDENLPPVVEIVQGIVAEQCKLVIGSGSKSFKTWLTLDLGFSIAHGALFLGRKTHRERVLYVNLELRPQAFKRRVQAVAKAKSIVVEKDWFRHLPLRGKLVGLPVNGIINRIIALAKRFKARVVILDPIYKLNLEGDENSSRDQTRLFNELDRITTEAGCTLILNDHFSKGNQSEKDPLDAIRGSSAKGGDVDAAMVLRKHEVEGCFRVDMVHRELSPVEPFCIGWKFPLMELRPDLDPEAMKKAKAGRRKAHDPQELVAAIADSTAENPVSIAAWAKVAKIPRQTLTDYVPGLRAKGWIATAGEGKNARQYLTEKGRLAARRALEEA